MTEIMLKAQLNANEQTNRVTAGTWNLCYDLMVL